ncbi:MAG: NAD-dependent epimerase/dehydratase family protein, partial [Alphaproteobacteria bacterium]
YLINTEGAKNLAISCKNAGVILIHISTDAVYDGEKNSVYQEDDECNPLSVYSKSKYAGEIEILKHHDSGIIIRTSWLYSLDKPNFVSAIINKVKQAGSANVVFDQLGTPTYTYDLAAAILQIIKSRKIKHKSGIGIYHYSNEGAISWYDFAISICRILKLDTSIYPIASHQYPTNVKRPFHSIMSKEKIKQDFGVVIPYWRDSLEICLSTYGETADQSLKFYP